MLLQRPATLLGGRWQALIGSWAYPDAVAVAMIGGLSNAVSDEVHGGDVSDYLTTGKRWQVMRLHGIAERVAPVPPFASGLLLPALR